MIRLLGAFLASVALLPFAHAGDIERLTLHLVSEDAAARHDAACLDGSLPGLYVRHGDPTRLMLYFKGGGWCYDEQECLERASTRLGTSDVLPKYSGGGGLLSAALPANPAQNDTMAYLWYCDGASFASQREGNVTVPGSTSTLRMRGRANLDAMMDTLRDNLGVDFAGLQRVIVAGSSAGSLAVSLSAVHLRKTYFSHIPDYAVLADAGWFQKRDAYEKEMNNVAAMGNVSVSMFARDAFAGLSTLPKVVITNALFDTWQLLNVLTPPLDCAPSQCNSSEIERMNVYAADQLSAMAPAFAAKKNVGVFVDACAVHTQTNRIYMFDVLANETLMAAWINCWIHTDGSTCGSEADKPLFDSNPSCPLPKAWDWHDAPPDSESSRAPIPAK